MALKIKKGFVLRKVGEAHMAVPFGPRAGEVKGMVALSETGYFLWKAIEAGTDTAEGLADALCAEYDVNREQALEDTQKFLDGLRDQQILEA